jgi:hypothetical protein
MTGRTGRGSVPRAISPPTSMSALYIGTSGWTYDGWRGPFYPDDVPKKDWLRWYGHRFNSAEINGSFYRTPSLEAVRSWRDQTPKGFLFSWKASKFLTHWKRLGPTSPSSLKLMNTRLQDPFHSRASSRYRIRTLCRPLSQLYNIGCPVPNELRRWYFRSAKCQAPMRCRPGFRCRRRQT